MKKILRQLWWLPALAVLSLLYTFATVENNDHGGMWILWTIIAGLMYQSLWVPVTRLSKNLYLDGLLFWACATSFYVTCLWLFGEGEGFSGLNWIGVILALTGVICLNISEPEAVIEGKSACST